MRCNITKFKGKEKFIWSVFFPFYWLNTWKYGQVQELLHPHFRSSVWNMLETWNTIIVFQAVLSFSNWVFDKTSLPLRASATSSMSQIKESLSLDNIPNTLLSFDNTGCAELNENCVGICPLFHKSFVQAWWVHLVVILLE